jgi:flagellar motor switch protein FliN/FliY
VTAAITELTLAVDAARDAASLLPATTPLAVGTASQQADSVPIEGQAIHARFTGAAEGQVAVIVGQEMIDALAATGLELIQSTRPALEAAATVLGPVTVDPGEQLPARDALAAIVAAGGALVPLTNETGTAAVVALAVAAAPSPAAASAATPSAAVPSAAVPSAAVAEAIGAAGAGQPVGGTDFAMLHDVELEVTAELGRTRMSVRELLALAPGAVIELDRAAGGPVDLLVNDRVIARGEVVVIDESFGIRITEIVSGGR